MFIEGPQGHSDTETLKLVYGYRDRGWTVRWMWGEGGPRIPVRSEATPPAPGDSLTNGQAAVQRRIIMLFICGK